LPKELFKNKQKKNSRKKRKKKEKIDSPPTGGCRRKSAFSFFPGTETGSVLSAGDHPPVAGEVRGFAGLTGPARSVVSLLPHHGKVWKKEKVELSSASSRCGGYPPRCPTGKGGTK